MSKACMACEGNGLRKYRDDRGTLRVHPCPECREDHEQWMNEWPEGNPTALQYMQWLEDHWQEPLL